MLAVCVGHAPTYPPAHPPVCPPRLLDSGGLQETAGGLAGSTYKGKWSRAKTHHTVADDGRKTHTEEEEKEKKKNPAWVLEGSSQHVLMCSTKKTLPENTEPHKNTRHGTVLKGPNMSDRVLKFMKMRPVQAMFMNFNKPGFITQPHSFSRPQTKIMAYFETGGHFVADPISFN